ncbi:Dickkopf N-terminal cysteine-rich domain-containing protein [Nanoarchaeota archaeon]
MKQKDLTKHLNKNKQLLLNKRNFLLGKPVKKPGIVTSRTLGLLLVLLIVIVVAVKYYPSDKTAEGETEQELDTLAKEEPQEEIPECEEDLDCSQVETYPTAVTIDQLCIRHECTQGSKKGGPCEHNYHCLEEEYPWCAPSTKTCQEMPEGVGKSCEKNEDCGDLVCTDINTPDEKTCQPKRKQGETCNFWTSECEEDLVCSDLFTEEETCHQPIKENEQCQQNTCKKGLYCEVTEKIEIINGEEDIVIVEKCAKQKGVGKLCKYNEECSELLSLSCNKALGSTCQPKQNLGGNCRVGDDCQEKYTCTSILTEERTCQLPRTEGQSCKEGDCKSTDNEPLRCNFAMENSQEQATCQKPQPRDGVCYYHNNCEGKLLCNHHMKDENGNPTCQTGEFGQECNRDSQCQEELICNLAYPGIARNSGTCRPKEDQGGLCEEDSNCKGSLVCKLAEFGETTCQAKSGEGERCVNDKDCQKGFVCNSEIANIDDSATCQVLQEENGACAGTDECIKGLVCNRAIKDAQSRATCQQRQDIGEKCYAGYGNDDCKEGLSCNEKHKDKDGNSICQPLATFGETCERNEDCDATRGLVCNGAMGDTCQVKQVEHGPCESYDDCIEELNCNRAIDNEEYRSTCQPDQEIGGKCYFENDCVDGYKCTAILTPEIGKTCQLPLPPGSQCDDNSVCEEENYCNKAILNEQGQPTCQPKQGISGKCTNGYFDCEEGLVCNKGIKKDGQATCQDYQPRGGVCDDDEHCQGKMVCNGGIKLEGQEIGGTCQEKLGENSACEGDDDCKRGLVCNNAFKDSKGRNTCQGKKGVDGACGVKQYVYDKLCQEGFVCNEAFKDNQNRPTCQEPQTEDGPCEEHNDCQQSENEEDSLYCNSGFKDSQGRETCQYAQGQWDPCGGYKTCEKDLVCNYNMKDEQGRWTCQPLQGVGGNCFTANQCERGLECEPGSTQDSKCVRPIAEPLERKQVLITTTQ